MRKATLILTLLALGCGGESDDGGTSTGGTSTGGTSTGGSGGATGGAAGSGGATGGAAGSGGATGGAAGAGGSTGGAAGAGGSTGGAGGTSGGCGFCDFVCCGSACINTGNDIKNCGKCGTVCAGATAFCDNGVCKDKPPCQTGTACGLNKLCCDDQCCNAGEICCDVPGPVTTGKLTCAKPVDGTCPKGCTSCVCNSPDTRIATPSGERNIADLVEGDLVYSIDGGRMKAVPLRKLHRVEAPNHSVVQVTLATGSVLRISPRHPTADGRFFADLRAGDSLDGVFVVAAELVPYSHSHTYDILPDSDTGAYFAGGVLIGSTISGAPGRIASFLGAPASR